MLHARHIGGTVPSGRVVIVGTTSIRAVDLKNGRQLWMLAIDHLPAGQGIASNGDYYLPLEKEIVAIDIAKGQAKSRTPVPAGAAVGNLVFYDNMLLSQTPTAVSAFPLSAK